MREKIASHLLRKLSRKLFFKPIEFLIKYSMQFLFLTLIFWIALYFKIKYNVENDNNMLGTIGDGVRGFFSPLIGFFSALLVYKSFTEQKRSNDLLSSQVSIEHTLLFMSQIDLLINELIKINKEFIRSFMDYNEFSSDFNYTKDQFKDYIVACVQFLSIKNEISTNIEQDFERILAWQRNSIRILFELEQYCKYIWIKYEEKNLEVGNSNISILLLHNRIYYAKSHFYFLNEISQYYIAISNELFDVNDELFNTLKSSSARSLVFYESTNFEYTRKTLEFSSLSHSI